MCYATLITSRRNIPIYCFMILSYFSNSTIWSQTKDNSEYLSTVTRASQINRYVIGSGGIVNSTNSAKSFAISSTTGQTDVDSLGNQNYNLYSGFWLPPLGSISIVPNAQTSWVVGTQQEIEWTSKNASENVNIEISRNNGSTWQTLFPNSANDGSEFWEAQMPRSDFCIIRVRDANRAIVFGRSRLFSIDPEVVTKLTNPTPKPAGGTSKSYRLISVPLRLDNSSPRAVLEDDLGVYDPEKWRLFDYQNGGYVEIDSSRNFTPGRSFILIVRETPDSIDTGSGELVADSIVTVFLDSGWNFIANPFNFPIPVSALQTSERVITFTQNGWSDPIPPSDSLKPWEGYAIKVAVPGSLKIRLPEVGRQSQAKIAMPNTDGWSIQVKAQSQDAKDLANYAGVRGDALDEWDHHDFYEPPPIGDYVMLYFPHREWSIRPDTYSQDFRPANNDSYRWNFEVRSRIKDSVNLTFAGLDEIPAFYEVWVLDKVLKRSQNLRLNNRYGFQNLKKDLVHELVLLVGNKYFIEEKLNEAGAIPSQYALFDNFPNPFNPTTAIRYALPEQQKVTLKIYNLFGQEVTSLLDGELKNSGYHIEYWDGRNRQGFAVASGVYLYQIYIGSFSDTKKMVLVK